MFAFYLDNTKFHVLDISNGMYKYDIYGHSHGENSYEIHYIYGGKSYIEIEGQNYTGECGTVYITGPQVFHRQKADVNDPPKELCIHIKAEKPEFASNTVNEFLKQKILFQKANAELSELFQKIIKTYNSKTIGAEMQTAAYIQLIIMNILNPILNQSDEKISKDDNLSEKRCLITENQFLFCAAELTLKSLSEKLGICPRQAERIVKEQYGKTFSQKKREAQIEMAVSMLLDADKSIAEISEKCGFYDESAFFKAFKAQKGVTPRKYIKMCNKS